jgi:hypothetical protein
VLDHARAGDLAVLGDVTDQQDGHALLLGQADQLGGAGANLGDRAGAGLVGVAPHRLDRVDDHEIEVVALQPIQDVAQRGLGGQADIGVGQAHAIGAAPDLLDGLFARDVGAGHAAEGGAGADLQQQGGLADTGVAADQDGRARHHAAAADPVELVDASHDARRRDGVALQTGELQAAHPRGLGRRQGARGSGADLLDQRIPALTGGALSGPLGLDRAAGLASVDGAVSGHGGS